MSLQNKTDTSLVVSSTKLLSSKATNFLSSILKKQTNFLQVDLFSKLANNGKLTNKKHKKQLKNNLCFYCSAKDHKLNFYSKK